MCPASSAPVRAARMLACLVLVLLPAGSRAAERNLIPNGDFEAAGAANPALPDAWTPHVHGKVSVAWSTFEPRSGKRCLEMAAQPDEKWGHAYWTSASVSVKPCVAYRVRFFFRSKGWGVPCFSLSKVKSWRLNKHDTKGEWLEHDEVVVVPPDVTETSFSVNNYHRPGKTMWLDDVSLVELPLAESPLTRRLERAARNVAALGRNVAKLRTTLEQEQQLDAMREQLRSAQAAYRKLGSGKAGPADFKAMSDGLDAVEKAIGDWLITVWVVPAGQWPDGEIQPETVSRQQPAALGATPDEPGSVVLGVMCLIDEGIAARAVATPDRKLRDATVRLLVTPAGRRPADEPRRWGALGGLGEVFLPPGTPRFLQLVTECGPKAKPGSYAAPVAIEALDRTMTPGRFEITVRVAP